MGETWRELGCSSAYMVKDHRRVMVRLSPLSLAANEGNRDVPHGCVGLGAMPMALTSLDVRHVADVDLALLMLRRHDAGARSHDQDLIAIVDMPSRVAAPTEVHHGAVVIRGLAGLDNGLASPKYRARPARGLLGRTFGRDVWDVLKRDDLHDARSMGVGIDERPNRHPVAVAAYSAAVAWLALRASRFARAAARRSSNLASRRFGFACTTLFGCPGSFCDPAQPWAAISKMIPERSVCLTS